MVNQYKHSKIEYKGHQVEHDVVYYLIPLMGKYIH